MPRRNKNSGERRKSRPKKGGSRPRKHMLDLIEQPKYDPRHDLPYVRVGEVIREREEQ